jgi:hypothetical protein
MLAANNQSYPEELKAYLSRLTRDPTFVGLDGQTFAVKVRCTN